LLDLQNPNDAADQNDAEEGRRIVNHRRQVFGRLARSPNRAVGQPGQERFRENEYFQFRIKRGLLPTAAGRCDDDMQVAFQVMVRRSAESAELARKVSVIFQKKF
jgi:hypothetical protein